MPENSQQFIEMTSKIRHYKGETSSINGPLFLDDEPYWGIYFIKKSFLRGLMGVTLIVLNEKGEVIRDWKTYEKIAIVYLMPKISERFVVFYSNELNEVVKMRDFFKNSQEVVHKFKITELLEKAKSQGVNELADFLTYFKMQLAEIEKRASKILKYMENTKHLIDVLLTRNEYSAMAKFVKRLSSEKKGLEKLRKNISDQAYTVFSMTNIIRELGMRREESKEFIESINKYVSFVRQIEKLIDRMIKTRRLILHMHAQRKNKVMKFYKEMLKRI